MIEVKEVWGWVDAKAESPDKDGHYVVMVGKWDATEDTLTYTVEGGWNTFRYKGGEHDGKLNVEVNGKGPTHWAEEGYVRAWLRAPKWDGGNAEEDAAEESDDE